jgi:hypothetical protein
MIKLTNRQYEILEKSNLFQLKNFKIKNRKKISIKDRWDIYKLDNFKCSICDGKNITIDHIVPISKGGKNEKDNYCALCEECNLIKKDNELIHLIYKKKLKGKIMYKAIMQSQKMQKIFFGKVIKKESLFKTMKCDKCGYICKTDNEKYYNHNEIMFCKNCDYVLFRLI